MIDKAIFESRGPKSSDNSYFVACKTSCCGRVGVEDIELHEFYYDSTDLKKTAHVYYDKDCPFCESYGWELIEISNVSELPHSWAWAKVR